MAIRQVRLLPAWAVENHGLRSLLRQLLRTWETVCTGILPLHQNLQFGAILCIWPSFPRYDHYQDEAHSNLTSGQLTCEDLPVRGAPVCSQTPDEQQEVTSPAPSLRLSSRPDSSDYFDDSRATVSRFPAPPTVRVGSENIMSHRQQCRIPHYSDARPGSRRFPALPTTLSNTALGRGDLREASMGKACYLTEYPLSAFE